ncbi:MAG: pyridoxamine 5'-phosphate oxidase family protein [Pseudomonadota bacterium]
MNSINQNQPEDNYKDEIGKDAVERIRKTVKKSSSCFFCTAVSTGGSSGARPMSVRKVDGNGTLWFLSASDSHTNQEIAQNPAVRLFFQGSEYADFMHLTGIATATTDKARIKDLWESTLKVWFTEGIDDPRITAIGFKPQGGYYWDNKHGMVVAGAKMLVGAMLGQTLDDSIEGKLRLTRGTA